MAQYEIDNDLLVETTKSLRSWDEITDWNGNNHISVHTRSQWNHEALYLSSKGNYYVVETSQWQGSTDSARWLDDKAAARWLLLNDEELPLDLVQYKLQIVE